MARRGRKGKARGKGKETVHVQEELPDTAQLIQLFLRGSFLATIDRATMVQAVLASGAKKSHEIVGVVNPREGEIPGLGSSRWALSPNERMWFGEWAVGPAALSSLRKIQRLISSCATADALLQRFKQNPALWTKFQWWIHGCESAKQYGDLAQWSAAASTRLMNKVAVVQDTAQELAASMFWSERHDTLSVVFELLSGAGKSRLNAVSHPIEHLGLAPVLNMMDWPQSSPQKASLAIKASALSNGSFIVRIIMPSELTLENMFVWLLGAVVPLLTRSAPSTASLDCAADFPVLAGVLPVPTTATGSADASSSAAAAGSSEDDDNDDDNGNAYSVARMLKSARTLAKTRALAKESTKQSDDAVDGGDDTHASASEDNEDPRLDLSVLCWSDSLATAFNALSFVPPKLPNQIPVMGTELLDDGSRQVDELPVSWHRKVVSARARSAHLHVIYDGATLWALPQVGRVALKTH